MHTKKQEMRDDVRTAREEAEKLLLELDKYHPDMDESCNSLCDSIQDVTYWLYVLANDIIDLLHAYEEKESGVADTELDMRCDFDCSRCHETPL